MKKDIDKLDVESYTLKLINTLSIEDYTPKIGINFALKYNREVNRALEDNEKSFYLSISIITIIALIIGFIVLIIGFWDYLFPILFIYGLTIFLANQHFSSNLVDQRNHLRKAYFPAANELETTYLKYSGYDDFKRQNLLRYLFECVSCYKLDHFIKSLDNCTDPQIKPLISDKFQAIKDQKGKIENIDYLLIVQIYNNYSKIL